MLSDFRKLRCVTNCNRFYWNISSMVFLFLLSFSLSLSTETKHFTMGNSFSMFQQKGLNSSKNQTEYMKKSKIFCTFKKENLCFVTWIKTFSLTSFIHLFERVQDCVFKSPDNWPKFAKNHNRVTFLKSKAWWWIT